MLDTILSLCIGCTGATKTGLYKPKMEQFQIVRIRPGNILAALCIVLYPALQPGNHFYSALLQYLKTRNTDNNRLS